MMSQRWRYVALETVISLVINATLSGFLTWAIFGRLSVIPYAGARGFGVDFLPQTFMVSLMSIIVPTLLTRRRLRSGGLLVIPSSDRPPVRLLFRAPLLAGLSTLVLGGGMLIAGAIFPTYVAFPQLVILKAVYGALVALIMTPLGLALVLREDKVAR